jgi:hypothetical protein
MLLEMENVKEVQRLSRNEFGTPPPTCVTTARLRDEFEADGTVQNVNKDALKASQFNCRWKC